MQKRKKILFEFILILIIILSSLAFRLYRIESIPKGIEGDELAWITSSLFAKYKIIPSKKGLWELNNDMVKAYPVSVKINQLGFTLFGKDIFSARKMLAVMSVLMLITFYLLSRKFFNPV